MTDPLDGFDLENPELPKAIKKHAMGSGGYPYEDKLDSDSYEEQMYQLLLCESSGNPAADSPDGLYHGLFQYSAETWGGEWNPYRDQSIYDAQAQIWATACAWNLGMQQQWGCYSSLAP